MRTKGVGEHPKMEEETSERVGFSNGGTIYLRIQKVSSVSGGKVARFFSKNGGNTSIIRKNPCRKNMQF